jgi:transposase
MMGSPNKSDEMDARLLAHYIAHGHHTYKQQDELCQEMIFQYREIQGIKKQRTRYINRLHQCIKVTFPELKYKGSKQHRELLEVYPSAIEILKADPKELTKLQRATAAIAINSVGVDCPATKRRLKHCLKMIRLFDDTIGTLETDLSDTIKQHPDYEIVTSFPAINDITAAVIIGTYQNIDKYPSRQCFKKKLGVAAEERTSGTSVSTTFINRRATGLVRTALHLVCISLLGPACGENVFKSYYLRRRENDTTRRPLLGRLKGKIAEMLYQCLKRRTPFDRARNLELSSREMHLV